MKLKGKIEEVKTSDIRSDTPKIEELDRSLTRKPSSGTKPPNRRPKIVELEDRGDASILPSSEPPNRRPKIVESEDKGDASILPSSVPGSKTRLEVVQKQLSTPKYVTCIIPLSANHEYSHHYTVQLNSVKSANDLETKYIEQDEMLLITVTNPQAYAPLSIRVPKHHKIELLFVRPKQELHIFLAASDS